MRILHSLYSSLCRSQGTRSCLVSTTSIIMLLLLPGMFLGVICIGIDQLLTLPVIYNNYYSRAVVDNMGHALIGGISWLIVVGIHREGIAQAVICAFMASAIDLDHFLAAGSFNLKDALSLHHRPPLHTTTIIPVIAPILQVWCAQHVPCLHFLPYMFTVSVLSHHIRDAQRHGLWFWPLGSTPPLPYWLYIVCIVILPYLVRDTLQMIDNLPVGTAVIPCRQSPNDSLIQVI